MIRSTDVAQLRRHLHANGFKPVAVYSHNAVESKHWSDQGPDKPVSKRGKRPKGNDWQTREYDPDTAKTSEDALNTGVRCDDVLGLDIDVDENEPLVTQLCIAAFEHLGSAPIRTRSNSTRVLLPYRFAADIKTTTLKGKGKYEGQNIQVLTGNGHQFVVAGIHPGKDDPDHPEPVPYEWPQGSPCDFHRDSLTEVTQLSVDAFLNAVAPLIGVEAPKQRTEAHTGQQTHASGGRRVARPRPFAWETPEARVAFNGECEAVAAAEPGTRNNRLCRAAKRLRDFEFVGHLERSKAMQGLWVATGENGTFEYADGQHTTRTTIERAFNEDRFEDDLEGVWIQAEPWVSQMVANWIESYKAKQKSQAGSLFDFLENIKPLQDYEIPPITYLVNGMIPEASIIMLSGGPGSGKSTLAMKIAYLASKGLPIFGTAQIPRRVLYLDKDNSPALVKDRMNRLRMVCDQRFKYWGGNLTTEVPKRIFANDELLRWLDREPAKPIVVIDSQIAFQEGKESDSNDIRAFYSPLRDLTYRGVSVIVIHHTGKGESTKEFRGSEDIRAAIDVGYVVNNSSKVGLNKVTLTAFKARVMVEEEIAFNYVDGEFIPQNLIEVKTDNLTQLLRTNPGIPKSEFEKLAMQARFSRSDIRNFIDTGMGFGSILLRKGEGNSKLLYLPENVPQNAHV